MTKVLHVAVVSFLSFSLHKRARNGARTNIVLARWNVNIDAIRATFFPREKRYAWDRGRKLIRYQKAIKFARAYMLREERNYSQSLAYVSLRNKLRRTARFAFLHHPSRGGLAIHVTIEILRGRTTMCRMTSRRTDINKPPIPATFPTWYPAGFFAVFQGFSASLPNK